MVIRVTRKRSLLVRRWKVSWLLRQYRKREYILDLWTDDE